MDGGDPIQPSGARASAGIQTSTCVRQAPGWKPGLIRLRQARAAVAWRNPSYFNGFGGGASPGPSTRPSGSVMRTSAESWKALNEVKSL